MENVRNVKYEDVKTHEKYGLKDIHAEVYGNLIQVGNVIKVGNSKSATWKHADYGAPDDVTSEPGKVSYIHTHPYSGNGTEITYDKRDSDGRWVNNFRSFSGGGPSPQDNSRAKTYPTRSVIVTRNSISLFNGSKENIVIEKR